MPDHRKPPVQHSGRSDAAPLPPDSLDFDIESTTMRLKSIRLRRREAELMEQHRQQGGAEVETPAPKKRPAPAPVLSRSESGIDSDSGERPSGRVRHDERGMAVWDWAVASGEFHTLSATSALKKLDVGALKIEETARVPGLSLEKSGRDKGGGFDPYNQRGSGKRQGEAAQRQGVTGADDRATVLEQLLGKK